MLGNKVIDLSNYKGSSKRELRGKMKLLTRIIREVCVHCS